MSPVRIHNYIIFSAGIGCSTVFFYMMGTLGTLQSMSFLVQDTKVTWAYIYICTHTHEYTQTHVLTNTHIKTHMHTYMHMKMYMHMHLYMLSRMQRF